MLMLTLQEKVGRRDNTGCKKLSSNKCCSGILERKIFKRFPKSASRMWIEGMLRMGDVRAENDSLEG